MDGTNEERNAGPAESSRDHCHWTAGETEMALRGLLAGRTAEQVAGAFAAAGGARSPEGIRNHVKRLLADKTDCPASCRQLLHDYRKATRAPGPPAAVGDKGVAAHLANGQARIQQALQRLTETSSGLLVLAIVRGELPEGLVAQVVGSPETARELIARAREIQDAAGRLFVGPSGRT